MGVSGRGPHLYVDGMSVRALITQAKAKSQSTPKAAPLTAFKRKWIRSQTQTGLSNLSSNASKKKTATIKKVNTLTEGTFKAYHPSLGERLKNDIEDNIDKIPVLNVFHMFHEQNEEAKKETEMELAAKGETGWKAHLIGALYGMPDLIDSPGIVYDTADTIWRSIPSQNQGALGLKHTSENSKNNAVITWNPDENWKNELLLAKYAPNVYNASKQLQSSEPSLEKQLNQLEKQRKQLEEQAAWFEANKDKAKNDAVFRSEYNAKVASFDQQVQSYNEQLSVLQQRYNKLKRLSDTVEKFDKDLGKTERSFGEGELVGSLAFGMLGSSSIFDTLRLVAPEETVESFQVTPELLQNNAATRATLKETLYKGWLKKKPIETKYSTGLVNGQLSPDEALLALKSGDTTFMKSFVTDDTGAFLKISGKDTREFVMNKVWSRRALQMKSFAEPRKTPVSKAEFERVTGKPFPVSAEKIDNLGLAFKSGNAEMDVFNPGAVPDVQSETSVAVLKSRLRKEFSPEFSLSSKEDVPVLSEEDWKILNKLTRARTRRMGSKWIKTSTSGNVMQTFYDPPTEADAELLQTGEHFTPDLGHFKLNWIESEVSTTKGVPLLAVHQPVQLTGGGSSSISSQKTLQELRAIQKITQKSKRDRLWTNRGEDLLKIKEDLRRKFGTNPPGRITSKQIQHRIWVPGPPPEPPEPPVLKTLQIPKSQQIFKGISRVPNAGVALPISSRPRKPKIPKVLPPIFLPFPNNSMSTGGAGGEGPWIGWGRKNDTAIFTLSLPKAKGGKKHGIL